MLEDEHDQVAIITQPNITYKCKLINQEELIVVNNPAEAPP
jgi:translation elongation factor EF-4